MQASPYEENARLLEDRSLQAQEKLYLLNRGLVHRVVEKFRGGGWDYDELFQIGSIGLLRAIRQFDPAYQARFSTYAVPLILGEIRRFLRENSAIHVQRSLREKHRKLRRVAGEFLQENGREPTIGELAAALGLAREEIAEALEACQPPRFLEEPLAGDETRSLGETLPSRESGEAFLAAFTVRDALEKLPEREQMVLKHRFFQEETQSVIARRMGISQVQVSRIEKNALKHLREALQV